jgi:hypothetical protein
MPDSISPSVAGEFIEKAGITVASIVGLLYVLRWLSYAHLAALNGRITTLEGVVKERDALIAERDKKIEELHGQMIARMETHAHDMQGIAVRMIHESSENRKFQRDIHTATMAVIEDLRTIRKGAAADYTPTDRPTIPQLPSVPETDRTTGRA